MSRRASLRSRLAVTLAAVVAAVVVSAFAAAYLLTRRELYRTLDATLIRQARQLQLAAKTGPLTPTSQCRFLGAPACSQVLSPGGSTERGVLSTNAMLARLEVALTAQRQLVADASHELRTPLTSIRTNATLLSRDDRLTPQERNDVARGLDNSIEEMIGLVGDVIDLARGDEVPHQTKDVRLDTLIERSVNVAARHWPQVDFRSGLERAHVNGVPQRLDRLIANLLDNASKFSSGDGVAVEIALTAAEDHVTIRVRDHGPGIADDDLPRIFHRFYRAPHARGLPGSGLGLAIVDQIAHAHGGTISAANSPDGGAVLTVELPTARTAAATQTGDGLHEALQAVAAPSTQPPDTLPATVRPNR